MAKKEERRKWFFNWFDETFIKMVGAVILLRKHEVTWHPCATRYFVPKFNTWVSKEEWNLIP